jgi:mRNA interferase RelE/StbE
MYRVELKPRAQKFIEQQQKKVQRQLLERIAQLAENPYPSGCKKLHDAESLYRVRSGDYRIIYQVRDKELLVLVVKVGDRKDVYRLLN